MANEEAYARLITYLDGQGAWYRLIDHAPEGRTEVVSPLRGNALAQAAKCIVLMVKLGKKVTRYVLCVVPGDARVDLEAVKRLLGGTYVAFASPDIAERLAGSGAGTILPFAFHPDLELIVDPALLENEEIYFNAVAPGSLDDAEGARLRGPGEPARRADCEGRVARGPGGAHLS